MYEENRSTGWSGYLIKGIIVIIFILFTVWLLSLSNKGIHKKLDVITDTIFAENVDRMKQVGKDYFTTERLPKKIGEIETISLEEMYNNNYILEIRDKNGHACSAKNSYVSVEKLENEYQMKIFLECGKVSDFIIVPMGCYNYCDSDICEKKESDGLLEYEYKKSTGGYWTNYGSWSEWSKVAVSKTNYREVETKIEKEKYSYEKTIFENDYKAFVLTCPSGYKKTNDGTKCYKVETKYEYANPQTCPKTIDDGFVLVSQNGFTCNYKKTYTSTTNPVACPETYEDYKLVSQNGFTCNYSKTVSVPVEDSGNNSGGSSGGYSGGYSGGSSGGSSGGTSQQVTQSCSTCAPVITNIGRQGYKQEVRTTTTTVGCPTGYTKNGNSCVSNTTATETRIITIGCPVGYTINGTKCQKQVEETKYSNFINTCPSGYKKTSDNTKCYKEISSVVTVDEEREVTYYRYRLREFTGATTDYKWSTSNKDSSLLNAGYALTGRTRGYTGK